MEVDVDPSQQQAEAEHLIEICKSGQAPTIAAVVSGRPAAEALQSMSSQFKGSPYVKGIRQVLHGGGTPAGYCLQDNYVRGIQLLGELGLELRPVLAAQGTGRRCAAGRKMPRHAVHRRSLRQRRSQSVHESRRLSRGRCQARSSSRRMAARHRTAGRCQRTRSARSAASSPACPKNGRPTTSPPSSIIASTHSAPSRVIFGSDWPVCLNGAPLRDWVAALKQIIASRPESEQRQLLRENAITFYGLKLT